MDHRQPTLPERYRSDLRSVVGSSATAYGYTLTVWASGSVLSSVYDPPSPPEVFAFFGGAVLAFAIVGVLAFGGVSRSFGGTRGQIELWGGFHFLSVGLAVGAVWLAAMYLPSPAGWPVGAFVTTALYLVVVGLENTAADARVGAGE